MTSRLAQPGFCLVSSQEWNLRISHTSANLFLTVLHIWVLNRVKVEVGLESRKKKEVHTDLTNQFSFFLLFLSASPDSPIRQVK